MDIDKYAYNMTTWQISNGGFFKAMADKYKNPYSSGEKSSWRSKNGGDLATIDNDATIQEMRLLATRYKETKNSTYKSAFKNSFNKAVNFLLTMQRSTGGLPQVWPKRGNYSDHITLNDNAMIRAMVTMMDIANSTSPFDSDIIDNTTRNKMRSALNKAVGYLLKAQIVNNGSPTVWCAQHDTANYAPRPARAYELESKSGNESAGVVWFLMNWPDQTPEIQKSIKSAIAWYKRTKVSNQKFDKNAGAIVASNGSSMWYRFYEVNNDNYFFCDRAGASTKTSDLSKISAERRTGYQWAGDYGSALLNVESAYLSAIAKLPPSSSSSTATSSSSTAGVSNVKKQKIDFVVGVDGDFKAAFAKAASASASKRFIIFVPDGEYDLTKITADSHGKTSVNSSYLSIIGQSKEKTIIANKTDTEGISLTATLYFPKSNDIYMQDITLQNKSSYATANAARQVALQQGNGDRFIYKNVRLLSGQDTYYTKTGRTYWEGGEIQGTVDFICGDGDVFFEGTKLVMTRKGGYITAASTSTSWGYVFNNTTIEVSNSSFDKTFYLGRSWKAAKTVFLNTTMKAQPIAEGWAKNMNSAPQVYGEYNSHDVNGKAIDVSKRKTYFDGSKDGSTATLKTVWNANDVAKYTLSNVMKGSDNWEPNRLTVQVGAPKIAQDGAEVVWEDDASALCWVVFVNGKYKTNVTEPSFSLQGIPAGSKVTVRAANSMGGLGKASNELLTLDANVNYYNVSVTPSAGGTVQSSLTGTKAAEGKTISIVAVPNAGWKFAGWNGESATKVNPTDSAITLTVNGSIDLQPQFSAEGVKTFQAEEGILKNASADNNNAGFAGSGFVNFAKGDPSGLALPVYVNKANTYTIFITYANGSGTERSLNITTASDAVGQSHVFTPTANWTTWKTDTLQVNLPAGASFIDFKTIGGNDGPNLDQIEFEWVAENEEIPSEEISSGEGSESEKTAIAKPMLKTHFQYTSQTRAKLFDMKGQLLRESVGRPVNMDGLRGVFLLQVHDGMLMQRRVIRR
ncbi:MAG: pectate lyase [Fibrobacter sp.]|nr:pectate lyase [Fibrobacter sp.]MDY6369216.1 pectate lyase [Fibrobacter sp.]MDY6389595.1 pectate lyase [Fibrobacter sp.]